MAIALGMENKRQVRMVIGLFAVIAVIAGWEVYTTFATPATHSAVRPVMAAAHVNAPARKPVRSRLDPVLRIDELNRSEQVEYTGNGRDVFSPILAPVVVEKPIASPRPDQIAAAVPPVVEPPKPPSMDLKYLGFAQTKDKTYTALFTHGDDMVAAKTGDIMFHRFRVGVIQPASVQVTDLTHNITQSISASN
ncbi:hypothetical protein DYQ86_08780 [Acidobacteria bacterium AB60]|nr:hypothetical protein DYQ86_08780 [Acidobacteria bacterium AB60]